MVWLGMAPSCVWEVKITKKQWITTVPPKLYAATILTISSWRQIVELVWPFSTTCCSRGRRWVGWLSWTAWFRVIVSCFHATNCTSGCCITGSWACLSFRWRGACKCLVPRGTGWMTRGLARRGTLCCITITLPVVGGCRTLGLGASRPATSCSATGARLQHKIGTIFLVTPELLFSIYS